MDVPCTCVRMYVHIRTYALTCERTAQSLNELNRPSWLRTNSWIFGCFLSQTIQQCWHPNPTQPCCPTRSFKHPNPVKWLQRVLELRRCSQDRMALMALLFLGWKLHGWFPTSQRLVYYRTACQCVLNWAAVAPQFWIDLPAPPQCVVNCLLRWVHTLTAQISAD